MDQTFALALKEHYVSGFKIVLEHVFFALKQRAGFNQSCA